MHSNQSEDSDKSKKEINIYYSKTKRGVDSHDQKCALFATKKIFFSISYYYIFFSSLIFTKIHFRKVYMNLLTPCKLFQKTSLILFFYFRCKAIIWLLVLLYIILGIFITLGNFTVILVYSTEKKMKHSQYIFRLFLGIADIIMGLIVLPATVNTMLKTYQNSLQLQSSINIIGQELFILKNGSHRYKNTTLTINMLETITMAENRLFSSDYKNSIGFFTNASFMASMYLLTVSGIDRLLALSKPLHYNQGVAKRFAILSSMVCWILAIFVSVLPTFVSDLFYKIIGNGPVLLRGTRVFSWYLIGVIIPLVVTWIISISLYLITQKTFSRSRNLSTSEVDVKNQRQLNFILILIVAVFSLSLLPVVLLLLLQSIFPESDPPSLQTYNSTYDNVVNSLRLTVVIILASNSLWNFLIYSLRIKTFRKVALEKYRKIWYQINCCKLFLTWKREQKL